MTEYHVEYRIEVDAESHEEAARKVAAILAGGGAGRGVYHVNDTRQSRIHEAVEIDLSQLECNACKRPASEAGELGYGEHDDLCYDCMMKADGYVTCPGCGELRQSGDIDTWHIDGRVIERCSSCVHNIRRSGGSPS